MQDQQQHALLALHPRLPLPLSRSAPAVEEGEGGNGGEDENLALRPSCCAACRSHATIPRFRCSRCRAARYCGRECQQADWEANHRAQCRRLGRRHARPTQTKPGPDSNAPHPAHLELARLVQSLTVQEAARERSKAAEALHQLVLQHREEKEDYEGAAREPRRPPTQDAVVAGSAAAWSRQGGDNPPERARAAPSAVDISAPPQGLLASVHPLQPPKDSDRSHPPAVAAPAESPGSPAPWLHQAFRIQHLPHLACYQLQLSDNSRGDNDCDVNHGYSSSLEWRLEQTSHEEASTLALFDSRQSGAHSRPVLSLLVPGLVTAVSHYGPPGCYRVAYRRPSSAATVPVSAPPGSDLSLADLGTLACRSCRFPLLPDFEPTEPWRVLPLPSSLWHDLGDYLTCYPGQPAVDVSSTAAPAAGPRTVLQDEISVVLPSLDLGAWCVLAVPGYGEDPAEDGVAAEAEDLDASAVRRGGRPWRDRMGGAALACPQCADVLGFAAAADESQQAHASGAHAARLLKHRVEWSSSSTHKSIPVLAFVAVEMVRYADTKAVFAFQVRCQAAQRASRRLLLRLLSWDTGAATSGEAVGGAGEVVRPRWQRLVQVLFEEAPDEVADAEDGADRPLAWMWTQRDWCCPPQQVQAAGLSEAPDAAGTSPGPATSLVRLFVSDDEYGQLLLGLRNASNFYSREVKDATILAKTGRRTTSIDLAAILL